MVTWRTAEVAAAEGGLSSAVAEAERIMRAAASVRGREPSTEDIRRVMQFAKSPQASPALRALADRIARGVGLSWRQVLTGEAAHDPLVRQALDENRVRLGELIQGEEIKPPPPRRALRGDDDEPRTYREDAW